MIEANIYPQVLLKHLTDNPTVAEWVRANTAPDDTATKAGQVSCDPETLKCLLPPDVKLGTIGDPVAIR